MNDPVNRLITLGLGVIAASKEQIEKAVDELVKKGEVTRNESKALTEELVKKGEETRRQIETMVRERMNAILGEKRFATREDIARIEQRLEALERKIDQIGK